MEKTLRQLVDEYTEAERTSNAAIFDALLHEDFVGIGPLGFTLTKTQWLDRFKSGDLSYESLELKERSIREYEHVAMVISHQSQAARYRDQVVKAELRTSMTFIKVDNSWKLLGVQMSSIGQPPQFTK